MPEPTTVLAAISLVLKPDGVLIAPNFTHSHIKDKSKGLNARILKLIGFETYSKWLPEEYVAFISDNGFVIENWQVFKAAFPLVYLEAHKRESLERVE
jgi:phosphatidylethanolamine/phosphatidyl-N-methylethanolamine N-methyltransferase